MSKAIQEQQKQIDLLKKRNVVNKNALEARVEYEINLRDKQIEELTSRLEKLEQLLLTK